MAHEITYDTTQLERLSSELAAFPREVLSAMRSSLVTGINDTLRRTATKHYALSPGSMAKTFKVFTRRIDQGDTQGIAFEVSGRRLTLSHFQFSPQRIGELRPVIEVIRGQAKQAGVQTGEDGKPKTPFVMKTGARSSEKVQLNVFVRTGRPQERNKNKEALKSYRTVSVPQMLENEALGSEIQERLIHVFDRTLFQRIENRTGLMQSNIAK